MSFRAPIGTNAFRQALRRREDSTPRDHRVVHEASRLVFCVLLGIPVKEIRISDASIQVHRSGPVKLDRSLSGILRVDYAAS